MIVHVGKGTGVTVGVGIGVEVGSTVGDTGIAALDGTTQSDSDNAFEGKAVDSSAGEIVAEDGGDAPMTAAGTVYAGLGPPHDDAKIKAIGSARNKYFMVFGLSQFLRGRFGMPLYLLP